MKKLWVGLILASQIFKFSFAMEGNFNGDKVRVSLAKINEELQSHSTSTHLHEHPTQKKKKNIFKYGMSLAALLVGYGLYGVLSRDYEGEIARLYEQYEDACQNYASIKATSCFLEEIKDDIVNDYLLKDDMKAIGERLQEILPDLDPVEFLHEIRDNAEKALEAAGNVHALARKEIELKAFGETLIPTFKKEMTKKESRDKNNGFCVEKWREVYTKCMDDAE